LLSAWQARSVLTTERLRLVPFSEELLVALRDGDLDRADILAGAPLPRAVELPPPPMLERCRAVYAADPTLVGFGPWLLLEDGAVVGNAGFHGPPEDGVVELGYGLAPQVWGRGLATEAATALVAWAQADLRVERIVADVDPPNAASQAVLAKLGFARAGEVDGRLRFAL
jgi:RimJ/RimL family protein N-acetyltransferase